MPVREKRYYVYIMASKGRVLYVGVTGFLFARVLQHKSGETDGFTSRYKITRLVYYEVFQYVNNAIARETDQEVAPGKENSIDRGLQCHVRRFGCRLGQARGNENSRFLPPVGMTSNKSAFHRVGFKR